MPEEHRLPIGGWHLDRTLDHHLAIREDVSQLGAVLAEHLPNQEPAVTLVGPAATAEQRQTVVASPAQHTRHGVLKSPVCRHRRVAGMAFGVVVLLALRTPAQLQPHEQVADAGAMQRSLQVVTVELRREA